MAAFIFYFGGYSAICFPEGNEARPSPWNGCCARHPRASRSEGRGARQLHRGRRIPAELVPLARLGRCGAEPRRTERLVLSHRSASSKPRWNSRVCTRNLSSVMLGFTPGKASPLSTDFRFSAGPIDLAMLKTVIDTERPGASGSLRRIEPRPIRGLRVEAVRRAFARFLFRAELRDFVTHPIGRLREAKHIHDWIHRSHYNPPPRRWWKPTTHSPQCARRSGQILRQLDQDRWRSCSAENSPLLPDRCADAKTATPRACISL